MRLPRVAISFGDPAGIGPEIALKAAADLRVRATAVPILFGDRIALEAHARACGLKPRLVEIGRADEIAGAPPDDAIQFFDTQSLGDMPLCIGEVKPQHGQAAVDAAKAAIGAALAGNVDAVVACPQTELAIKQAGIEFDGYPSFVARTTGTPADDAFLMMCFDDKRIVHTTLHVSLRRALALITPERVARVIDATQLTLNRVGIKEPRIAMSGLNPHAGEDGLFGDDEIRIISPAIKAAATRGLKIEGPFGADTMFLKPGYDAFIVMLHDQGHIAAKLLATNRTAGLTIGTPILFSSVAHGSALDIAGKNKASAEAVVEAVQRLTHAAHQARHAA